MRPIGYFVHHQGRGHAERCAALVRALPRSRPVTIFCARDDIFPDLPPNARIVTIPSLFEARGDEPPGLAHLPTPETLHCAPVGWAGIREATATLAEWFRTADPALFVTDVSAELAQLARICSVPHVCVLQHGDRGDPGHMAAYAGALGLLAPFDAALAQPDWPGWMVARTHFAGGLGLSRPLPDRAAARRALALPAGQEVILILSGGGGGGMALAPLGVGARTRDRATWLTLGHVAGDWHATVPSNLRGLGWVDDPETYVAAADLVISSTGNTTCHEVLSAGRPWIAVPEWRYFDEQHRKAQALDRAGVAHVLPHLPSSAQAWGAAIDAAFAGHDADRQRALVRPDAAQAAARWLDDLATAAWADAPARAPAIETPAGPRVAPDVAAGNAARPADIAAE